MAHKALGRRDKALLRNAMDVADAARVRRMMQQAGFCRQQREIPLADQMHREDPMAGLMVPAGKIIVGSSGHPVSGPARIQIRNCKAELDAQRWARTITH